MRKNNKWKVRNHWQQKSKELKNPQPQIMQCEKCKNLYIKKGLSRCLHCFYAGENKETKNNG